MGDTAVTVASDRHEFVESLAQWEIDIETDRVDYGVEFDPAAPSGRLGLRPLPRLRHGSCDLFRLRDLSLLEQVSRRVLGSFGYLPGGSVLRIGLMPIVAGGTALLVPPSHGGALSHRWFERVGATPWYTVSCLVDFDRWVVTVDSELGADGPAPTWWPIDDWWIPSVDPDAELSPGHAVAQVMRLASLPAAQQAGDALELVAETVVDKPPRLAPMAPDRVLEQFDPDRAERRRRRLRSALSAALGTS